MPHLFYSHVDARGGPPDKSTRGLKWTLALAAILFLSAVPRLYLAVTQYIEYDGYWHVFIAQQGDWENFWFEQRVNAHPPLFFLLLKAALALGRTPVVYRSISLIAGIAAVFLIWSILRKTATSPMSAAAGALAYGLALPAIVISCEVRAYMLSAAFVLASFFFFLDFTAQTGERRVRSRVLFALMGILACLSHYGAFFFVAACAGALVLSPCRRRVLANIATFAPVFAVLVWLYWWHAGSHAVAMGHLTPFYLPPGGRESVLHFLRWRLENEINLFSPFPIQSPAGFILVVLGLLAAAASLVFLLRRQTEKRWPLAIPVCCCLLLGQLMMAGTMGKYPFGGELRQQFFLFPFVVLSAALLFDRALDLLQARAGAILSCATAAAILAISTVRLFEVRISGDKIFASATARAAELGVDPHSVYLDQFNLIGFFANHDDWRWAFLGRDAAAPSVDLYRLTRGGEQILLFRDKARWNLDYAAPELYEQLGRCIKWRSLPALTVVCVRQQLLAAGAAELQKRAPQLAAAAGLCLDKGSVSRTAFYAELRRSGCAGQWLGKHPPSASGVFDDRSDETVYSGTWSIAEGPPAFDGTLTASSQPGSAAQLSFRGTRVSYLYTTAWNRGRAEVLIDGARRATLDLYTPWIGWRARKDFAGLGPGSHTIVVRVLGQHAPASADAFVDVDAFVVE